MSLKIKTNWTLNISDSYIAMRMSSILDRFRLVESMFLSGLEESLNLT